MADYTGSATGAQIDAAAQGNFTDDVTITGGRVVVTDSDAGLILSLTVQANVWQLVWQLGQYPEMNTIE